MNYDYKNSLQARLILLVDVPHGPLLGYKLRVPLANSVVMKLPFGTLVLLLPLVASSMAPKKRKRNDNNSQNTIDNEQPNPLSSRNELEKHLSFNMDVPLAPNPPSLQEKVESNDNMPSTAPQQMVENNNNNSNNIIQNEPAKTIPLQLTWDKKQLASLVKDLRQMRPGEFMVNEPNLHKIIVKDK